MKESFYFSHDSNARNDVKIIKLRRIHGFEGYGIFWCIIEMLRDAPDNKLPYQSIDDIAFNLNVSSDKLHEIINDFELFSIENNMFFSSRLIRNMDQYKLLKEKRSVSGKLGMEKRWTKQQKMVL